MGRRYCDESREMVSTARRSAGLSAHSSRTSSPRRLHGRTSLRGAPPITSTIMESKTAFHVPACASLTLSPSDASYPASSSYHSPGQRRADAAVPIDMDLRLTSELKQAEEVHA